MNSITSTTTHPIDWNTLGPRISPIQESRSRIMSALTRLDELASRVAEASQKSLYPLWRIEMDAQFTLPSPSFKSPNGYFEVSFKPERVIPDGNVDDSFTRAIATVSGDPAVFWLTNAYNNKSPMTNMFQLEIPQLIENCAIEELKTYCRIQMEQIRLLPQSEQLDLIDSLLSTILENAEQLSIAKDDPFRKQLKNLIIGLGCLDALDYRRYDIMQSSITDRQRYFHGRSVAFSKALDNWSKGINPR